MWLWLWLTEYPSELERANEEIMNTSLDIQSTFLDKSYSTTEGYGIFSASGPKLRHA
jgi:hypothetical protein